MNVPSQQIAVPWNLTELNGLAWLPQGQIILQRGRTFWYRTSSSTDWHQLSLDSYPPCPEQSFSRPSALPDGRLGLHCGADIQNGRILWAAVAYDWSSRIITPLVPSIVPKSGKSTWNPAMTRGVLATLGSYSTLYWLSPDGTEPITATISDERKSWTLSDTPAVRDAVVQNPNQTGYERHTVGEVGQAAWSPTGEHIAFWGSLYPIGRTYNPLQRIPWDLYLMDPRSLQVTRILTGIYDAHLVEWAPDGSWLAYTSPDGLWLIRPDMNRKQPILVHTGYFRGIAWSPSGEEILAGWCEDEGCLDSGLWLINVNSIVKP